MSGLALLAQAQGHVVSGSDLKPSRYVEAVLKAGIPVSFEQGAANIVGQEIDIVVASSAVADDNPELLAARQRGLPVWMRAEMLAWLGRDLRTLAVAGTHGKTTTSAMLASSLYRLGADPSFVVGGVLLGFNATAHLGQGGDYVVEADESDGSFTLLSPSLAIITNIDRDHMNHFESLGHIIQAFKDFIDRLEPDGCLIYCADDLTLSRLAWSSGRKAVSFGFAAEADFRYQPLGPELFSVRQPDARVNLSLSAAPGVHNMSNAAAVLAALRELGYAPESAALAVSGYSGVGRRFDIVGVRSDITVIDDYGHHPAEVKATLAAARRKGSGRLHVLFQPHRYSRTAKLFDEFVDAFGDADSLALLDIYAAGEAPIGGVSSAALARAIKAAHPEADVALVDAATAVDRMAAAASPGDFIMTMGAGDVTDYAPAIIKALNDRKDA
jgi:UDP-N-acetylmuramate--alanine ligase